MLSLKPNYPTHLLKDIIRSSTYNVKLNVRNDKTYYQFEQVPIRTRIPHIRQISQLLQELDTYRQPDGIGFE